MNPIQLLALIALAITAFVVYVLPILPAMASPRNSMADIQDVLRIRDAAKSPAVREACAALLAELLK